MLATPSSSSAILGDCSSGEWTSCCLTSRAFIWWIWADSCFVDPSNSMNNSTIMVRSTASIEPDESQSQDVPAPYFIKPSGFRPNSLFVGREAELTELHKMIFDKKRRAEGTSAVLIQSMPGGGKSHLARQYVYQHKDDFPGGIFWLRAKSAAELASGFWDIARKAALKHLVGTEEAGSLDDPQQFIKMVKKWLNHRNDWLMVLDGIHFDDTEELSRFIPDSTNTGLIYTSTEKSVSGSHYFMNPQVIKLPLLSAVEAQRLLLLELDRKEPFSKDDLKHSMELVQAMGFLPVVIHSVAQRLKTTDEPLSKFARHYANEPRLRGLGTYMAVVEQLKILGAYEALNLVYILCFFSQHIPVEMIALGIKALEYQYHIPVKASEPITGRSLNNTFKMLNTFALIDRNEHEVSMHSSQSSKSSRDMLADNVDVIRLHSVVQGFFVDTLLAEGTLSMWLDLAVRVFCCSYDLASERILRKTNAGLVEDYRLYEIHGIKIGEHLTRHLSRHLKPDERIVLEAAQKTLSKRCEAIKSEIERRTPEFSQVIAGRKSEQFQTSIFDRTSSSSDTGPETPGIYGYPSRVSTWGLEPEIGQIESPSSITHDAKYYRRLEAMHSKNFPMPMPEDDGYDSDRESSVAMTLQPSQQTVQQDPHSPTSPGKDWKLVERKQKGRTAQPELGLLHRTIRNMEKQRYSDSAGAYRAVSAPDPRVSHEAATGFLQRNSGRAQSRGRLSGQSSAEVALADISKNSPPPTRGGGVIRPTSQRGSERGRVMTGMSSYAAAVAEATRDTVSSVKELVRPPTEASQSSPESTSTLELPQSSAVESLQKFPIEVTRQPPSPILSTFTPMPIPPYPQTPHGELPDGQTAFPFDSNYNQENTSLGLDPYPSNIYPRKTGPIPFETRQPAVASSSTSPPRNLQQGYPTWQSQTFSGSLPSAPMHMPSDVETPPFLSLSTPDITRQQANNAPYYPGRPELSNQQGGYTSQPMSRDPSGQSKNNSPPSNHSAHSAGHTEGRRRPSLAETEPLPQLPIFSPRIPPTSYQVYERMKQLEREGELRKGRELERGATNKIPRLEYARAALIERLDEWNSPAHSPMVRDESISPLPTTRRQFNPTAPSFSPSPSSFTRSPNLPTVPPNSTFSNPSTNPSAGTSAYATAYPSPLPPHNTPQSFQSFAQPQVPHSTPQSFQSFTQPPPPHTTPQSFHSVPSPSDRPHSKSNASVKSGGEEMGRSGSGGVKVGGKMIEFGDFPEKVDADAARQRVLKSWSEKEKKERERREASLRNERERREREKREASLKEERERRERSVGGSAEANNTTGGAVGLGIRRV